MKTLVVIFLLLCPCIAIGAEPSTSCPVGYVAIDAPDITISNASCPNGYISVGAADSCLVSTPSGSCVMYAPTGTEYTDTNAPHKYEFVSVCPME